MLVLIATRQPRKVFQQLKGNWVSRLVSTYYLTGGSLQALFSSRNETAKVRSSGGVAYRASSFGEAVGRVQAYAESTYLTSVHDESRCEVLDETNDQRILSDDIG